MVQLEESHRHWMDLRPNRRPFASYFSLVFLPACLPVRAAPAQASAPLGVEQELLSARPHASVEASAQPHVEVSARLGVEAEPSAQTHVSSPWEQTRAWVEPLAQPRELPLAPPHASAEPLARHALSSAQPRVLYSWERFRFSASQTLSLALPRAG